MEELSAGTLPRRSRTLLFCTAFGDSYWVWRRRYRRWLDAIRAGGLEYNQILLIDDGSPVLPNWPDLTIIRADRTALPEKPLVMARFATHLGKTEGPCHSPGWYRSFAYAAQYARAGGFDKLIHIESDTFVISARLEAYINQRRNGWTALWCPLHQVPEDNIQVIAGPALDSFVAFAGHPYSDFATDQIEKQYPFTTVERDFIGDRYGEYCRDVPLHADYAVQTRQEPNTPESYFWWLTERPREAQGFQPRVDRRTRLASGVLEGRDPMWVRDALYLSENSAGAQPASSDDVVFAYNLVLVRDPENTNIIDYLDGMPILELIANHITSTEFRQYVLQPLLADRDLAYRGCKPLANLQQWLLHELSWNEDSRKTLLSSTKPELIFHILRNPDVLIQVLHDTSACSLFDLSHYSSSRGLPFDSTEQAVRDYLEEGAALGADPNDLFDTDWYEFCYLGSHTGNINPLVHFILVGGFDFVPPSPRFNSRWFEQALLHESASGLNALLHYLPTVVVE